MNVKSLYYRFYFWLSNLSNSIRYSGTVVALLLLLLLWWHFCYKRVQLLCHYYLDSSSKLRAQNKACINAYSSCEILKDTFEKSTSDLNKSMCSSNDNFSQSITLLLDTIRSHSLLVESCNSGSTVSKKWYMLFHFTLNLQGTFQNLLAFFKSLETISCYFKCSVVDIKRINDTTVGCYLECLLLGIKPESV
jgi:hypothetical protein